MTIDDQADNARPQRIALLDLLRGFAIFGTLGTNIWIFTDPQGFLGVLNGSLTHGVGGVNDTVESVLRFLANGKALATLTILFGVGVEIQRQSAQRRGRRWPGWYLWRAALLFADGFLHYLLVVEFDILMGYAVTSIVVAYLVATSDRAVRGWMILTGSLHLLAMSVFTLGAFKSPDSALGGGIRPSSTLFTEGSWWAQVQNRWSEFLVYRAESIMVIPMGVFLFLLGMRLYRAGAFAPNDRGRQLRRRMLVIGLCALPLNALTGLSGNPGWFFVDRYVLPPVVALLYIGLIGLWLDRRSGAGTSWLQRRLVSVGRMALSGYVLQNVVASVLCYGWGFGLAASLGGYRVPGTVALWIVVVSIIVLFCELWLRRFDQGPIEWLWKLAYQAPQRIFTRDLNQQ